MTYNGQTGNYPPKFGPFSITNSSSTKVNGKVFDVSGLSGDHVAGFTAQDCAFNGVSDTSNTLSNVDGLKLVNVKVNGKKVG